MEQYSHYRGTRRRRERKKGIESVFEEIIAENFPKLGEEIVSHTMKAHRTPKTRDPRKTTPRHIIIKMAKIKDKDRVLKAAGERKKGQLQRKTHQTIIRLPNRNFTGQKRMA